MGGCESIPGGLASSARERFIILFYYMRSYPLNRKPSLDYGAECPTAKLRHHQIRSSSEIPDRDCKEGFRNMWNAGKS